MTHINQSTWLFSCFWGSWGSSSTHLLTAWISYMCTTTKTAWVQYWCQTQHENPIQQTWWTLYTATFRGAKRKTVQGLTALLSDFVVCFAWGATDNGRVDNQVWHVLCHSAQQLRNAPSHIVLRVTQPRKQLWNDTCKARKLKSGSKSIIRSDINTMLIKLALSNLLHCCFGLQSIEKTIPE